MTEILNIVRNFMKDNKVDYLLINSTNKFLVEYNTLAENSRYHLTGFTGSTGDALVSFDKVYLFVDGRYHIQADLETDKNIVSVVKLQPNQSFLAELLKYIPQDATLGIFSQKNSKKFVDIIQKNVTIKLLDTDPLDIFTEPHQTDIVEIPENLTGLSSDNKINQLNLKSDEALLLTNLEEVSYLFNLRDFSLPYSSKICAKAIVTSENAVLFEQNKSNEFEQHIKTLNKKILVDKNTINAYDYSLISHKAIPIENTPVKYMKSIKTKEEISHYKKAFELTDKSLLNVRKHIMSKNSISEYDITQILEEEFYRNKCKNLSFNPIVAKNKNSALAHYSKSSVYEIVENGDLVLIDCGGFFEGGLATDITRVFVKGKPSELHKKVYTTVLKAFLLAYNTQVRENLSGFEIDLKVRRFFEQNKIENFVFNHGLGHGIGINVHEAPPNLSMNEIAKSPIQNNMCFTIEPGLYDKNHFGIRLENSCYMNNGKIDSFVHFPYESKLIDTTMLDKNEKLMLNEFEVI